jgi:hypothetical protein
VLKHASCLAQPPVCALLVLPLLLVALRAIHVAALDSLQVGPQAQV